MGEKQKKPKPQKFIVTMSLEVLGEAVLPFTKKEIKAELQELLHWQGVFKARIRTVDLD